MSGEPRQPIVFRSQDNKIRNIRGTIRRETGEDRASVLVATLPDRRRHLVPKRVPQQPSKYSSGYSNLGTRNDPSDTRSSRLRS